MTVDLMSHPKKIVLHCPQGYQARVDTLVSEFIRDGVSFVGVVGQDCARVEDIIDELVVGDGTREPYSMLTSSHPDETVAEAVEFAEALTGEYAGEVHVIEV
jgi:hypothetical protein